MKNLLRRWQEKRAARRFEIARQEAMFRATNGERLPRLEREALNLPDWTG